MSVEIEFDADKDVANIEKHGMSLALSKAVFDGVFIEKEDSRKLYGEARMIAKGFVLNRLSVCIYTWRDGVRRIISLRKANRREQNAYYKSNG
jgi:uncharacterized protein